MGVSADIQLGPGLLYVAPLATAEPTSASAALPSAWREIGYCVDDQTEILTGRGWVRHNEIQDADECLTLSPQTGLAEWAEIQAVHRFDPEPEREMVRMVGQNHDSLSTPNHRWLVDRHYAPSAKTADSRLFVTTESFGWNDSVPCAAPVSNLPTEAKYQDAFVEVVGWWITEGAQSKNQLSIYQSEKVNPQHCATIRAALTTLFGPAVESMFVEGTSTRPDRHSRGILSGPAWREYSQRDSAVFYLNKEAGEAILEVAPDKVLDLGFVRSLTKAQLHLLIDTVVAADGWVMADAGTRFYTQNRKDRIDPIQIAATLAGIRANLNYRADIGMWNLSLMVRNSFRPKRAEKRGQQFQVERVKHDGMIWCPSTANTTWLARRNGKVYFTGNTEEGSAFTYEITSEAINVAEEFDPIRYATTGRSASIAFSMAEVTRRNLALALNAGANEADNGTSFEPPAPNTELRVMIIHEPDEPASRWLFRQCLQTDAVEIARRKAPDKALIPVTFRLEKPTGLQPFICFPDADGRV